MNRTKQIVGFSLLAILSSALESFVFARLSSAQVTRSVNLKAKDCRSITASGCRHLTHVAVPLLPASVVLLDSRLAFCYVSRLASGLITTQMHQRVLSTKRVADNHQMRTEQPSQFFLKWMIARDGRVIATVRRLTTGTQWPTQINRQSRFR